MPMPPPALADPLDADDPYARSGQTFPRLSEAMAARVAAYGTTAHFAPGAALFSRGERSVDFFLVVSGAVEIFDTADGTSNVFTTHTAGQFTGELDLFNDRAILVSGRAAGDTTVIRVRRADFRRMVSAESDIAEIVMRAFILRRVGLIKHAQGGVVLIGAAHSSDLLRLARFLTRNGYPHRLLDTESDPDGGGFIDGFALTREQLPVVILPDDRVLRNPDIAALADALGLTEARDPARVHDLAVVGAGPAGLAAAVYGASEGLDTIVLEALAPGGQAGTSSKIENYLGFPTGISGQALAGRAQAQAQKFGARLAIAHEVAGIDCGASPYALVLDDGSRVQARSIVVATGARYRKLDVANYDRFEGNGIHYAATAMEASLCGGEAVAVIGGGNSAGQAAVFLSRVAAHVHILVRGPGLAATMSDYLVQRIEQSGHITVHAETEITGLDGDAYLAGVRWTDRTTGIETRHAIRNIFVMIGAVPNTGWASGCLDLDAQGFIVTGSPASTYATSKPGVYAVGDVRSGSIKRVASGVGEGSVVIAAVHKYLDGI